MEYMAVGRAQDETLSCLAARARARTRGYSGGQRPGVRWDAVPVNRRRRLTMPYLLVQRGRDLPTVAKPDHCKYVLTRANRPERTGSVILGKVTCSLADPSSKTIPFMLGGSTLEQQFVEQVLRTQAFQGRASLQSNSSAPRAFAKWCCVNDMASSGLPIRCCNSTNAAHNVSTPPRAKPKSDIRWLPLLIGGKSVQFGNPVTVAAQPVLKRYCEVA